MSYEGEANVEDNVRDQESKTEGSYPQPEGSYAPGDQSNQAVPANIKDMSDDEVVQEIIKIGMRGHNSRFPEYKRTSPQYLMKTISDPGKQKAIVAVLKQLVANQSPRTYDNLEHYSFPRVLAQIYQLCSIAKEKKYLHTFYEDDHYGISTVVHTDTTIGLNPMFAITFDHILTIDVDDKLHSSGKEERNIIIQKLRFATDQIRAETGIELTWRIYDTDRGIHLYCSSHYFDPSSEIACWFMYYAFTDINHFAFSVCRRTWGVRVSPKINSMDDFVARLRTNDGVAHVIGKRKHENADILAMLHVHDEIIQECTRLYQRWKFPLLFLFQRGCRTTMPNWILGTKMQGIMKKIKALKKAEVWDTLSEEMRGEIEVLESSAKAIVRTCNVCPKIMDKDQCLSTDSLSKRIKPSEEVQRLVGGTLGTCFDYVMQMDEDIQSYLAEDENNFVVKIGNRYECQNIDHLRRQHGYALPDGATEYNVWYPCHNANSRVGPDNVELESPFIKMTSSLLYVRKPTWVYSGKPPEPRIFEIQTDSEYAAMASKRYREITGDETRVGLDGCNHRTPVKTYRLLPTQNSRPSPPDKFTVEHVQMACEWQGDFDDELNIRSMTTYVNQSSWAKDFNIELNEADVKSIYQHIDAFMKSELDKMVKNLVHADVKDVSLLLERKRLKLSELRTLQNLRMEDSNEDTQVRIRTVEEEIQELASKTSSFKFKYANSLDTFIHLSDSEKCADLFTHMFSNQQMYPQLHRSKEIFEREKDKYCTHYAKQSQSDGILFQDVRTIDPSWRKYPLYNYDRVDSVSQQYPHSRPDAPHFTNYINQSVTVQTLLSKSPACARVTDPELLNTSVSPFDLARIGLYTHRTDMNRIIAVDMKPRLRSNKYVRRIQRYLKQSKTPDTITQLVEDYVHTLENKFNTEIARHVVRHASEEDLQLKQASNEKVLQHIREYRQALVENNWNSKATPVKDVANREQEWGKASQFLVCNTKYIMDNAFQKHAHIYETLNPILLTKLFFDLEMEPKKVRDDGIVRNANEMLDVVVETISDLYKSTFNMNVSQKDFCTTTASLHSDDVSKDSFHITVNNNTPFNSLKDVNHFAWFVVEKLWLKAVSGDKRAKQCFWKCNNPNCFRGCADHDAVSYHCFIDEGVYTNWRQFRIYKSSKWARPGKPIRKLEYFDVQRKQKVVVQNRKQNEYILKRSLIQYTPLDENTRSIVFERFSKHYHYPKRGWTNENTASYDYTSRNYNTPVPASDRDIYPIPKNIMKLEQGSSELEIKSLYVDLTERYDMLTQRSKRLLLPNIADFLSGKDVATLSEVVPTERLQKRSRFAKAFDFLERSIPTLTRDTRMHVEEELLKILIGSTNVVEFINSEEPLPFRYDETQKINVALKNECLFSPGDAVSATYYGEILSGKILFGNTYKANISHNQENVPPGYIRVDWNDKEATHRVIWHSHIFKRRQRDILSCSPKEKRNALELCVDLGFNDCVRLFLYASYQKRIPVRNVFVNVIFKSIRKWVYPRTQEARYFPLSEFTKYELYSQYFEPKRLVRPLYLATAFHTRTNIERCAVTSKKISSRLLSVRNIMWNDVDISDEINDNLPQLWPLAFATDRASGMLQTWKGMGASLLGRYVFYKAWISRTFTPVAFVRLKMLLQVEPGIIKERGSYDLASTYFTPELTCKTSQVPLMIISRKVGFHTIKWFLENTSADINDEVVLLDYYTGATFDDVTKRRLQELKRRERSFSWDVPKNEIPIQTRQTIVQYLLGKIVDNAFNITYKKRTITVRRLTTFKKEVPDVYLPNIDKLIYDVKMCENILKLKDPKQYSWSEYVYMFTLPPVESENFLIDFFDKRIREALRIYNIRTAELQTHFSASNKKLLEQATKSVFTQLWTYIQSIYETLIDIHKFTFKDDELHRNMDNMYERLKEEINGLQGRRSNWHRLHNRVTTNNSAPLSFYVYNAKRFVRPG